MRPSPETSRGLMALFVRHKVAANLLMALFVLFGLWGLSNLNRQLMPNVETRNVNVSVAWSGASAEDVERNILLLLEPAVRGIDGVISMTSQAREGRGSITLGFERTVNMQNAERQVQSAVAAVNTLPSGADTPVVAAPRFFDPIAAIGISGPFPEEALRRFAREIRDGLLAAGVDRVEFTGYRDRQVLIEIDDATLRQLDMTLTDLATRLQPNFADQPSGSLPGDFDAQIRAAAREVNARQIASAEVMSSSTGEVLTFGDIATVIDTFDSNDRLGYMRGEPAIKLQVSRAAQADTVDTYERIKAYVEAIEPTLPPSLNVVVFDAAAEQVEDRLALLVGNGLSGLALVTLVLFIFLDKRIAFWVTMGIPISIIATLGIMYVLGLSIDMISMFAMMMALGIIVDDAIIVGENTATRYAAGESRTQAAITGAGRMVAPVMAAALTTMAAFAPIWLVGDAIGQMMAPLPIVMVAVLMASLIECFFILPGHLAHALPAERKRPSWFRRNFDAGFAFFRDRIFGVLCRLSYGWRYLTVALSTVIAISAVTLVMSGQLRFEFFPTAEGESFNIFASFQPGIPQDEMEAILLDIEDSVTEVERGLTPAGEQLIITTYANLDLENGGANFDVYLTPSEERSVRTSVIIEALRENLPAVAGVERIGVRERRGGPQGRALDIQFSGADSATLKQASEDLQDVLEGFPGVTAVSDTLFYGSPELIMSLNSRGASLGFDLNTLGAQVRDAFQGRNVATIAAQEEEINVRIVRNAEAYGSAALRELWVRAPGGTYVPLASIVDFSETRGFAFINRTEGRSSISVRGDVEEGVNADEVLQRLAADYLPLITARYGIDYSLEGRRAEQNAAFRDLAVASLFAFGVMYIIIAWVFASYLAPFAVMLIIPFGLAGAVWGHFIMDFSLTMVSMMGMLGLAGIMINNSIVLISRYQERLGEGESIRMAVTGAARDRLRAVLLTSLTTIGGLSPLLFERSLQAQFLLPMVTTIVFGLAVATVLVLFLVPALIGIGNDIGAFMRWAFMTRNAPRFRDLLRGRHHDERPGLAPAE